MEVIITAVNKIDFQSRIVESVLTWDSFKKLIKEALINNQKLSDKDLRICNSSLAYGVMIRDSLLSYEIKQDDDFHFGVSIVEDAGNERDIYVETLCFYKMGENK